MRKVRLRKTHGKKHNLCFKYERPSNIMKHFHISVFQPQDGCGGTDQRKNMALITILLLSPHFDLTHSYEILCRQVRELKLGSAHSVHY